MAIGPTLKEARLRKKLTTSQVAEMTRVKLQIVDDLENDDFHRIAAPIYGKGFIKLVAACLDLDPTPLIADFMSTVTGGPRNESPVIREVTKEPGPVRAPEPSTPAEEPPVADLFEFASSRRRRITPDHSRPSVASPVAAPSPALAPSPRPGKSGKGTVHNRHRAHSAKRPLATTILRVLHPLLNRGTMLARILKTRLASLKWSDRMLKPVGIVLAALVALLVLVAVIRSIVARTGPRPPEDHELLLFIPPPEPYVE